MDRPICEAGTGPLLSRRAGGLVCLLCVQNYNLRGPTQAWRSFLTRLCCLGRPGMEWAPGSRPLRPWECLSPPSGPQFTQLRKQRRELVRRPQRSLPGYEGGGIGPEKGERPRPVGKLRTWASGALWPEQPRPQANRKHPFHANHGSAAQRSPDSPKLQSCLFFLPLSTRTSREYFQKHKLKSKS